MKCSVDEFEVNLPACWYALKGQGRHWSRLGWLKPCEYLSLQGHRYFHRPHLFFSCPARKPCFVSYQLTNMNFHYSLIKFHHVWMASSLNLSSPAVPCVVIGGPSLAPVMLESCSNLEIAGMYPKLHYATPDSDVPHPSQPTFAPGPWSSLSPTPPLVGGGGSSQFQDFHSMGSSLEPKQGTVTRVAFVLNIIRHQMHCKVIPWIV